MPSKRDGLLIPARSHSRLAERVSQRILSTVRPIESLRFRVHIEVDGLGQPFKKHLDVGPRACSLPLGNLDLPSSQFIKDCKKNPNRVLIAHPYNPPHIMPLVEVVPNSTTSKESIDTAMAFFTALGKAPILLRQEVRGSVANRLQAAISHEAFSLVKRGIVTAKEIDNLGPSWSFTGPFMKDVLGGGANAGGFRHLMEHVGVTMQDWLKDVVAHSYEYTDENLNVLDSSVKEMLAGVDIERLEEERNNLMIEVFKAKASAKALV
ncbi:hypothetical protein EV356DRAFT_538085 [Viridothelium virens]|uniref:3-hydroxyacyl-CoA dehydrogenase NAD binding domain-containing protein n=1 Tax=Viridothelium virens TaxID=1048519 RepID=A0A6A6GT02_VIRVR|nr:hypothetical protein EV356DRAFT_538085 [Viridothelium virens]